MRVMAMTPSRVKIPLEDVERVRDVKAKLMAKTSIPVRQQIIYFRGRQLRSLRRPLTTYGVGEGSTLYLVKKLVICRCIACRNSRYIEREEVAEERERDQVIQPLFHDDPPDLDDFIVPDTEMVTNTDSGNAEETVEQNEADTNEQENEDDAENASTGLMTEPEENDITQDGGEIEFEEVMGAETEAEDAYFEVNEDTEVNPSEAEEEEIEDAVDNENEEEEPTEEVGEQQDDTDNENADLEGEENDEATETKDGEEQEDASKPDDTEPVEIEVEDTTVDDTAAEDADEEDIEDTEEEEEDIELVEELPQEVEDDDDDENVLYRLATDGDIEADTTPQINVYTPDNNNNDLTPTPSAMHFPRQAQFEEDGTNSVGEPPDVADLDDEEEPPDTSTAPDNTDSMSAADLLLNMTRPTILDYLDTEEAEQELAESEFPGPPLLELRPEDEDPGYMSEDELDEPL